MKQAKVVALFSLCLVFLFACRHSDMAEKDIANQTSAVEEQVARVRVVGAEGLEMKKDQASILEARLDGERLHLRVQYGGGARQHDFELLCLDALAKSMPPKATLYLSHNANGDLAKALITQDLVFDLAPMRELVSGPVLLRIIPPGETQPIQEKLVLQ